MCLRHVATAAWANSSQPRFKGTRSKIYQELFVGPVTIAVLIYRIKNAALPLRSSNRIGWHRHAKSRVSYRHLRPQRKSEMLSHFVRRDLTIAVGVEVEHC